MFVKRRSLLIAPVAFVVGCTASSDKDDKDVRPLPSQQKKLKAEKTQVPGQCNVKAGKAEIVGTGLEPGKLFTLQVYEFDVPGGKPPRGQKPVAEEVSIADSSGRATWTIKCGGLKHLQYKAVIKGDDKTFVGFDVYGTSKR